MGAMDETSVSYLRVGGIVSETSEYANKLRMITKVYANIQMDVSANAAYIGGIAGYAKGDTGTNSGRIEMTEVYAVGNITSGRGNVGGIMGYSYECILNDAYSNINIENKTGTASGIAAEVGYATTIKNTYAVGDLDAPQKHGISNNTIQDSISITNSYYSPKSTGVDESGEKFGTTKTIQELLYQNAYSGYNFSSTWAIEPEGGSLAYLKNLGLPKEITKDEVGFETRVKVKREDMNGNRLEGGSIEVKDGEGQVVKEGSTNSLGVCYIKDLTTGEYTLQEKTAPKYYAKSTKIYNFKMTEQGTAVDAVTGEVVDLILTSDFLKVELENKDINTDAGIEGSVIGLYTEEGEEVLGEDGEHVKGITDINGKVTFMKIEPGTYKYKQISVEEPYILDENEYTVTITTEGTVEFGEDNQGIIYNKSSNTTEIKEVFCDSLVQGVYNNNLQDGMYIFRIKGKTNEGEEEEKDYLVELINEYEDVEYTVEEDGNLISLGDTSTDKKMLVVKYHKNLTIGAGVTVTANTVSNFTYKKGMFICVMGDLVNNGTISMTERGTFDEQGENVYLLKNSEDSFEYVPAEGALGGSAVQAINKSGTTTQTKGTSGATGENRSTGGGGSGGAIASSMVSSRNRDFGFRSKWYFLFRRIRRRRSCVC